MREARDLPSPGGLTALDLVVGGGQRPAGSSSAGSAPAGRLGLVAGGGPLPALVAREARREGWRIVAFALGDLSGELAATVDRVVPVRLGDVGPVLSVLAEEGIRHVVLAGKVTKAVLFQDGPLDGAARELAARSADWTDDGLLSSVAQGLAALGVELLDQRRFLGAWLAPAGHLAGPFPGPAVERDIACGLSLARELAARGIGQSVMVRAGAVVAVEAMEGTDETIRRGLRLAGRGATLVKAAAPAQDYRFDVPTVGPDTVALLAEGGAAALALEAGRVLVLDPDAIRTLAAGAGLAVVGVGEPPARG